MVNVALHAEWHDESMRSGHAATDSDVAHLASRAGLLLNSATKQVDCECSYSDIHVGTLSSPYGFSARFSVTFLGMALLSVNFASSVNEVHTPHLMLMPQGSNISVCQ